MNVIYYIFHNVKLYQDTLIGFKMNKSNIKNKAMVEITGFGLKGFEDNLSFFDKEYSASGMPGE